MIVPYLSSTHIFEYRNKYFTYHCISLTDICCFIQIVMKPLYLNPNLEETPREQWDRLTEKEKWEEYLQALVTIDELGAEIEGKSININN